MTISDSSGEFVWVFGPSASGKFRLINDVFQNQAHPLRTQLRWLPTLKVCEESLRWVAERVCERDKLVKRLCALEENGSSILIKGQWADFDSRRPQDVRKCIPNAHHRVIFLRIGPKKTMVPVAEERGPVGKQWFGSVSKRNKRPD